MVGVWLNRGTSSQLSGSQLGTLKQKTSQSDLAQEWGLNQQEWTRYQTLMQGPRGVYSASSQLSGSQLDTLKQQTSQSDLAQEWGLNQQEWTRYQTLMQGPRGVYSAPHDATW